MSAPTWNDKFELLGGSFLYQTILSIFKKNMDKILIIHQ